MASVATSTAVSNPNDRDTRKISLSMVFGIPIIDIFKFRFSILSAIFFDAIKVPSPPTRNKIPTFILSRQSTIIPISWVPLEEPKIEPPVF